MSSQNKYLPPVNSTESGGKASHAAQRHDDIRSSSVPYVGVSRSQQTSPISTTYASSFLSRDPALGANITSTTQGTLDTKNPNKLMEGAPGAVRAYEAAFKSAASIYAVPQHEEIYIGLEDGWDCVLKRYQYKPLTKANEIRLVRLHPWKDRLQTIDGKILPRCELLHVTLDSLPEYAALSYTWGDLREFYPIILDQDQCLGVTKALYTALFRLSGNEPLDYWVDQICINQYDLAERSDQVKLMGKIFKQSIITSVWLGVPDDTTTATFDLIDKIASSSLTLIDSLNFWTEKNLDGLKDILQHQQINFDDSEPGWAGLEKLSSRPWFSRLWTFQEVVVAKSVVYFCGNRHCSDDNLLQAFYATRLVLKCYTPGLANAQLLRAHNLRHYHGLVPNLLELLQETSHGTYECKNPRDRVYALLALQNQDNLCAIHVDYSETVEAVFQETAKAIIINEGSLDILHRRRFGYLEKLPSWVPDWASQDTDEKINGNHMKFSCSGGLRHIFKASAQSYLITRGKVVANILRVATHNFSEYLTDFQGDVRDFLGITTLVPQLIKALKKFLIDEGALETTDEYIYWLLAMTFTCGRFFKISKAEFNTGNTTMHEDLAIKIAVYGHSFVQSLAKCIGRKVCMLDRSAYPLGLVPNFARAGDLICVLNGSSTPLVLRKSGDDFEYIGECYVHGIMFGEAVDWTQEEGDTFRII